MTQKNDDEVNKEHVPDTELAIWRNADGDPVKLTPVYENDIWFYRIVVTALSISVLLCILGAIYLAATKEGDIPEILIAIGSAAVGALAGVLSAHSR